MRITSSMLQNLYGSRRSSALSSIAGRSNTARRANGFSSSSLYGTKRADKTDTASYQKTQSAAAGVREHAQKLTDTSEDSIWSAAEKSGSGREIADTIVQFAHDYNTMLGSMKKTGGTLNNLYRTQLNGMTDAKREELSAVGISVGRDGTLAVNKEKLGKADAESVKKLFAGSSSFAGQAAVRSIYVEANAVSGRMQQENAAYLGYNAYGGFGGGVGGYGSYGSSFGAYGANLGNYFNSMF